MLFSTPAKTLYEQVSSEEDKPIPQPNRQRLLTVIFYLTIVSTSLAAGLMIGFYQRTAAPKGFLKPELSDTPIPRQVITPPVQKLFVPDERYVGSSPQVEENWKELVRASDSIWLEDPEAFNLGKGIQAPWEDPHANARNNSQNFYLLSNLHQLHCTNIIRRRYWHIIKVGISENDADYDDWLTHVDHCFEYLRLSITCGDFLVFEPDSPPGTPEALTVDNLGWGVTHSCINFDRLLEYQQQQAKLYAQSKNIGV